MGLDLAEALMELEERYGVELPDSFSGIDTVGDLVVFVWGLVLRKEGGDVAPRGLSPSPPDEFIQEVIKVLASNHGVRPEEITLLTSLRELNR